MRMSAVARHRNFMPKENSKNQQEKRKKAEKNYRPRICCAKCKKANTTFYKFNNKYYCKECILKEEK